MPLRFIRPTIEQTFRESRSDRDFPDKFGGSTGNHYLRDCNSAHGNRLDKLRWWNGRHEGLKILWPFGCAGSSPARSTNRQGNLLIILPIFILSGTKSGRFAEKREKPPVCRRFFITMSAPTLFIFPCLVLARRLIIRPLPPKPSTPARPEGSRWPFFRKHTLIFHRRGPEKFVFTRFLLLLEREN